MVDYFCSPVTDVQVISFLFRLLFVSELPRQLALCFKIIFFMFNMKERKCKQGKHLCSLTQFRSADWSSAACYSMKFVNHRHKQTISCYHSPERTVPEPVAWEHVDLNGRSQLGMSDRFRSVGTARGRRAQLTSACIPASSGTCGWDELGTDADGTEPFLNRHGGRLDPSCRGCVLLRQMQRLSSLPPSAGGQRSPSASLSFLHGCLGCFFWGVTSFDSEPWEMSYHLASIERKIC